MGFPLIDYSQGKLHRIRYQLPGTAGGHKWRHAWVDPAVVPDARGWLESRLGPMAGYELVTVCFALKAEGFSVGALDWGTPPKLTVREPPAMWHAIDAAPPEYFAEFGITKESWEDWRAGGEGTQSGTSSNLLPWSAPAVEEIFPTPEELAALRALPSVVEGQIGPGTPRGTRGAHAPRDAGLVRGVLGVAAREGCVRSGTTGGEVADS